MILYDSLLAPALYHNYLNERRYWQVAPLHRRLAIEAEVRASLNGAGGAPLLAVPPGALPVDADGMPARARLATVARDALETTRQIGEDELVLHDVIGTGGFAEVYRATWTPKQSAPRPHGVGSGWSGARTFREIRCSTLFRLCRGRCLSARWPLSP